MDLESPVLTVKERLALLNNKKNNDTVSALISNGPSPREVGTTVASKVASNIHLNNKFAATSLSERVGEAMHDNQNLLVTPTKVVGKLKPNIGLGININALLGGTPPNFMSAKSSHVETEHPYHSNDVVNDSPELIHASLTRPKRIAGRSTPTPKKAGISTLAVPLLISDMDGTRLEVFTEKFGKQKNIFE